MRVPISESSPSTSLMSLLKVLVKYMASCLLDSEMVMLKSPQVKTMSPPFLNFRWAGTADS